MTETNFLEVWDSLKYAIQEAHTIIDLKKIRDKAEAYRYALKLAGESVEIIRKAEEIKLRAERRAGELIANMPKQRAGEYKRYKADTVPSYKDQGINKLDASKWQRIARIPSKDFERWIKSGDEISSTGALKLEATLRYTSRIIPPLPDGKYDVIYADPPWQYTFSHSNFKKIEDHYPTMSLDEICDMGENIKNITSDNCTLFLWITSPHLDKFPSVLKAWDFRYCTSWVWDKQGYSYGHYGSIDHEILIIGGKGRATPTCNPKQTAKISSVQSIHKTGHSVKPVEYYGLIETLYPNKQYLELFARTEKRNGWTHWGDELN